LASETKEYELHKNIKSAMNWLALELCEGKRGVWHISGRMHSYHHWI
jgi:hypothetical protein